MSGTLDEGFAAAILRTAISEGRASEMLDCLFEGGAVTVDAASRRLVLIPGSALAEFAEREPPEWCTCHPVEEPADGQ